MVELPSAVAVKLDVFVSIGQMILGPRGWTCQTRGGYEGVTTIRPSDSKIYGVTEIFVDGTSDAHTEANMDTWANAYFPLEMKSEILSGNAPVTNIKVVKYSTDKLEYISPKFVIYQTPAGHIGIGDDILVGTDYSLAEPNNHAEEVSIQGFMRLVTKPDLSADHVDLFAIALPEKMMRLSSYIQDYAENLN